MKLNIILLFCFFFVVNLNLRAQERIIVPLTKHFISTKAGTGEHMFNKLINTSNSGELIERIFNLDNRPLQITKYSFRDKEATDLILKVTHNYNLDGDLTSIEVIDSFTDTVFTKIHVDNRLVFSMECNLHNKCKGVFVLPDGSEETVDRNIFEPSFKLKEDWNTYLRQNFTYPDNARRNNAQGVVWLGIKIGENGELLESEIINLKEVHSTLIKEVRRVFSKYEGEFIPARDFKGNPITAWKYIPVRFELN